MSTREDEFDRLWNSTPAARMQNGGDEFSRLWESTPAPEPTDPAARVLARFRSRHTGAENLRESANNAGAAIRQGMLPGWADNLRAAVRAAPRLLPGGQSFGEAYKENVEEENERLRAHREAHPVASAVQEVGGGILTGSFLSRALPAAGGGTGAAQRVANAVRSVTRRPITGGAAIGAVAGAGENEEDRAAGAVSGAGWGAGAGAAFRIARGAGEHVVKPLASAVLDAIPNARARLAGTAQALTPAQMQGVEYRNTGLGTPDPSSRGPIASNDERALDMILTDVRRARLTPDDLANRGGRIGPTETIMDILGQPGARRGRQVQTIPSEGSARMETFLDDRMAGQEERLIGALEASSGQGRRSIRGSINEMIRERDAEAATNYGPLRGVVVDDPRVSRALRQPAFQGAYNKAVAIRDNEITQAVLEGAENPPEALPALDDLLSGRANLTLGTLDQIKRGLDDVIGTGRTEGLGGQQLRSLGGVRRAFVNVLDEAVPDYRDARSAFAGPSAMVEAMERGRDLFRANADVDEIREALADMGESEIDAFRKGATESLARAIEGVDETYDATVRGPLRKNTRARQKLRLLFPDDESAEAFVGEVEREGIQASTRRTVNGGSVTGRIAAEQDDLAAHVAQSMQPGGGIGAVVNALRNVAWNKAVDTGLSRGLEARVDALAPRLTATGPELQELIRVLRELDAKKAAGREATKRAGTFGAGVVGGQSSR